MAASPYLVFVRGLGGEESLLSPGGGRLLLTSAQGLGLDGFCVLYPGTVAFYCKLWWGGREWGLYCPSLGTADFCFICSPHTAAVDICPSLICFRLLLPIRSGSEK